MGRRHGLVAKWRALPHPPAAPGDLSAPDPSAVGAVPHGARLQDFYEGVLFPPFLWILLACLLGCMLNAVFNVWSLTRDDRRQLLVRRKVRSVILRTPSEAVVLTHHARSEPGTAKLVAVVGPNSCPVTPAPSVGVPALFETAAASAPVTPTGPAPSAGLGGPLLGPSADAVPAPITEHNLLAVSGLRSPMLSVSPVGSLNGPRMRGVLVEARGGYAAESDGGSSASAGDSEGHNEGYGGSGTTAKGRQRERQRLLRPAAATRREREEDRHRNETASVTSALSTQAYSEASHQTSASTATHTNTAAHLQRVNHRNGDPFLFRREEDYNLEDGSTQHKTVLDASMLERSGALRKRYLGLVEVRESVNQHSAEARGGRSPPSSRSSDASSPVPQFHRSPQLDAATHPPSVAPSINASFAQPLLGSPSAARRFTGGVSWGQDTVHPLLDDGHDDAAGLTLPEVIGEADAMQAVAAEAKQVALEESWLRDQKELIQWVMMTPNPRYLGVCLCKSLALVVYIGYHFDTDGGWRRFIVVSAANYASGMLMPLVSALVKVLLPLRHMLGSRQEGVDYAAKHRHGIHQPLTDKGLAGDGTPNRGWRYFAVPEQGVLSLDILFTRVFDVESLLTCFTQGATFVVVGCCVVPTALVFGILGFLEYIWVFIIPLLLIGVLRSVFYRTRLTRDPLLDYVFLLFLRAFAMFAFTWVMQASFMYASLLHGNHDNYITVVTKEISHRTQGLADYWADCSHSQFTTVLFFAQLFF